MSTGPASDVEYLRRRLVELERENARLMSANRQESIPPEWANIPGVGTWTYQFDASRVLASAEFFRICGIDDTGEGWIDLARLSACIHPEDRSLAASLHSRCVLDGLPYTGALRILRPDDGSLRWIMVSGNLQLTKRWLAGTIHDITDLKITEQAFRIVEQRFRVVAQAAHQIIYTISPQGTSPEGVLFWQNLTGQTPEESAGMGWLNAVHADDQARVASEWQQGAKTLSPIYSEYRVMAISGIVHAAVRAIPLFESDGSLREWVVAFTDITERKLAAQALAESERKLRSTTEQFNLAALALGALIYDWDTETGIVDRVRGLEEIVGYRPDEVSPTAEWWHRQIHPDDLQASPGTLNPDIHGRLQVYEYRVRHKLGHYVHVRDSALLLAGDRGINRVVGCAVDITQQKHAEEALHRQADELARSNAELQQFAYAASHDLQEPLRSVSIYTDLLRRRYHHQLGPEADQYIDFAVAGARRMEALLHGLLDYSRISNATDPAPVDCAAVLHKVLFNLAERIRETGAEIECDQLPPVAANEIHVLQLLQNVIGNALKYRSTDKPKIQITAERKNGFHQFRVRDNGIGVARQHQSQIFGLFRRLHSTGYEGTGIGLAICDRIVKTYGGSIWVESSGEGQGSAFYFQLPAAL